MGHMGHGTDSPLDELLAVFDRPKVDPVQTLVDAGIREIVLQCEQPAELPLDRILPPLEWLTPDQRERFEERAAIYEFDAGMTRQQAEQEALAELIFTEGIYGR